MPDPHEVQSSNAGGAAGGLNAESAFADVDDETAVRLKREAKPQAEPQLTADQLNPAAGVAGEAEDPGFEIDER